MNVVDDEARSVFLAALDREPGAWPAYLDEACAGNAELRARVNELLDAHQALGTIHVDRGQATAIHQPTLAEGPGTVIGPYKLQQQIGEGGMGVVFMAEQTEPIQRTVALKIIKPGMDTRQVIARFEAERQALAMMDHPNIAKVLDAGTTDTGRPYFVMELVKGIPMTKYGDDHKLSLRERLELFKPVCEAVQHAHQKGIIHRDLKPTNVLVADYDGRPVPKIIDFGIAKATAQKLSDRTMFTEFGQVIGTVEYMSPEQARLNQLDIDTRSDIYSLGVLLYELLTSSTPFERQRLREAAFDEVLRIIREEDPPRPSTRLSTIDTLASIAANRDTEPARLSKDVRGELDWIVMKCLEKDRTRRYETASGLARDIEHILDHEPVSACPPSALYKFRKFVRRNRVPAVATLLVACAVLLGTATTAWQAIRATRAQRDAEVIAAREAELRQRAEAREMITKAESLWDAGDIGKADVLLRNFPQHYIEAEPESVAPLLRALAHWHAGQQHWSESASYYNTILFGPAKRSAEAHDYLIDPTTNGATKRYPLPWCFVYFEFAPLLVELGDTASYDRLRDSAIARYSHRHDSPTCERMLHTCLLSPVKQAQMDTICQWAEVVKFGKTAWDCSARSLFEHRRGHDEQTLEWSSKGLERTKDPESGTAVRLHLLSAMAYARLNRREQALAEIDQCRGVIDRKFAGKLGVGKYGGDLWADWLMNRILLREVDSLLATGFPSTSGTETLSVSQRQLWDAAMDRARHEDTTPTTNN